MSYLGRARSRQTWMLARGARWGGATDESFAKWEKEMEHATVPQGTE